MLVSKYRTLTHDPKIQPRIGPMVTNAEHLMCMASPHGFVLRARIISCCCRLGAEGAHGINQPCKTGAMLYHCCSRLHEQLGSTSTCQAIGGAGQKTNKPKRKRLSRVLSMNTMQSTSSATIANRLITLRSATKKVMALERCIG